MALIVREAGKTLANALGEVREAVDFLRYSAAEARRQFAAPRELPGRPASATSCRLHGRGVFACISPWNFPLAIFTGQIAAALAAGNAVVAKPAEQTPLVAAARGAGCCTRRACRATCCISCPASGETVGAALVADPRVAGVVFTGATETGIAINRALAARDGPIVPLIAETGGQNAMIVDSSALPEQVVRDALASAFDSAGQRCSALRVLFLQDDVADTMIEMLLGAARELEIGDPLDYATDIGPVIDEEAKHALEAHKARMRGEARELLDLPLARSMRARQLRRARHLRDRVARRCWTAKCSGRSCTWCAIAATGSSEVFDAINATGYGLTLGSAHPHRGDRRLRRERVRVGNIYVNRNQIGAVVGVQPFGGEGLSGTGPKAGGPHYLQGFAAGAGALDRPHRVRRQCQRCLPRQRRGISRAPLPRGMGGSILARRRRADRRPERNGGSARKRR